MAVAVLRPCVSPNMDAPMCSIGSIYKCTHSFSQHVLLVGFLCACLQYGWKKIGGDFFHLYNGGHALPGLCGDSKITYVIDQSCASYTYWWFLTNRIMAYGSTKTIWKMSLRDCSLESPFHSVHDIYCQGDHNPVSPKGAKHRQPWTQGCSVQRWQQQGRWVCFRVRWEAWSQWPFTCPLPAFPCLPERKLFTPWPLNHGSVVFSIWPSPVRLVSLSVSMTWWWVPAHPSPLGSTTAPGTYSCSVNL